MKRLTALLACAGLCLASAGSASAGPGPGPGPGPKLLPDLIITQFGLQKWGTCAPGKTLMTFSVTVKNIGTGTWSGTNPNVDVRDLHPAVNSTWFSNVNLFPPLAPGHSTSTTVDIVYLTANPAHMASASPHPFQAVVNRNHAVPESNFANNEGPGPATWMGKKVIMAAPPKTCGKK